MIGLLAAIERDYVYCLPSMCYWMEFQCVLQMFGVIRAQNYKILAEIMCPKEFCRLFFPLTRQLKKTDFSTAAHVVRGRKCSKLAFCTSAQGGKDIQKAHTVLILWSTRQDRVFTAHR